MTENEAIKWLREMQNPMMSEAELYCAETYYGSGKMVYPEPEDYVFETAIQALEEIQQYRAIGTVRQVQDFIADWRKYRELGTLEEFKALKEKNEPKKIKGIRFTEAICPKCESELFETYWAFGGIHHCSNCGQKIDWQ